MKVLNAASRIRSRMAEEVADIKFLDMVPYGTVSVATEVLIGTRRI
jgi:hypothetical protein